MEQTLTPDARPIPDHVVDGLVRFDHAGVLTEEDGRESDDGGPDDQLDVERAHSILVEEVRDLNVCRRRHCSSRKACMRDTVEDAQCAIELPLLIATSASNSRQRRPRSPPASLP